MYYGGFGLGRTGSQDLKTLGTHFGAVEVPQRPSVVTDAGLPAAAGLGAACSWLCGQDRGGWCSAVGGEGAVVGVEEFFVPGVAVFEGPGGEDEAAFGGLVFASGAVVWFDGCAQDKRDPIAEWGAFQEVIPAGWIAALVSWG